MAMKKEISSIELRSIMGELKFLEGSRADKVIESRDAFYMNFYVRAKGNFTLRIVLGKYLYLTKQKAQAEEPGSFCLSLRKNLANSVLSSIAQVESERIARLDFEKGGDRFILFIELFGKGNIILCDGNEKVISLLEKQKWKDRTVAVGRRYEYPKKSFNAFSMTRQDLESLKDSKADSLVKALAADVGLGGVYAEEICLIANIDKNLAPKKLAEQDLNAIHKSLNELLSRKPSPKAIMKDEKVVNIVPFDLEHYESCEFERYESYNMALDSLITSEAVESREEMHSREYLAKAGKIQKIIDRQKESLEKANRIILDNKRKGEMIYENYAVVKEILDELNKAKQKHSWQEIKERLKGHKTIISINEKDKKVLVEIL